MKYELLGLLGLGSILLLYLATPDGATERDAMRTVVAGMMPG